MRQFSIRTLLGITFAIGVCVTLLVAVSAVEPFAFAGVILLVVAGVSGAAIGLRSYRPTVTHPRRLDWAVLGGACGCSLFLFSCSLNFALYQSLSSSIGVHVLFAVPLAAIFSLVIGFPAGGIIGSITWAHYAMFFRRYS